MIDRTGVDRVRDLAVSPYTRAHLIRQLGGRPAAEVIPVLGPLLQDPEEHVRIAAAMGLGNPGWAEALPFLTAALHDEKRAVRHWAARSVGVIGDVRAVPDLAQLLDYGDWVTRARAVEAMGALRHRATVPALTRGLHDRHRKVRRFALQGLAWQETVEAVDALRAYRSTTRSLLQRWRTSRMLRSLTHVDGQ